MLALILVNKVGSPQYMTWIIAPLAVGPGDRPPPLGATRPPSACVMAGLTQVIYPMTYGDLLGAESLSAALLTLRNVLVAVLLVWAVVRLARVPRRARIGPGTAAPEPSADAVGS